MIILSMDKPVIALELGHTKVKVVVGYELNGQVYVIYAFNKPYGVNLEESNNFNFEKISNVLQSSKSIADPNARIKFDISDALICINPIGLEIYQTKQITTVLSEENKVSRVDLKNLFSLVRNSSLNLKDELIDIVPEVFTIDDGKSYSCLPVGQVSTSLSMFSKIHTLPKNIYFETSKLIESNGINIKKTILAPHSASLLISSYQDMPDDYLLVDIGSNLTSVSLVGGNVLYASRTFNWGGNNINKKIIETFNISEEEAERIKVLYGIEERIMNFKIPICASKSENGVSQTHYVEELKEVIMTELNQFSNQLNASINSLLEGYDNSYKQLPMIFTGGGSCLKGMIKYITPKVTSENVILFIPNNLGARDATYTNCLGMILAFAKYPNFHDDVHIKVGTTISREENKNEEKK